MPKGKKKYDTESDSQALGMCKRLINLMMNNFTGHDYKRLPLNSGSATHSPKSPPGQEVVIDFRHIEVPENAHSQHSDGTSTDALINNRQKSWQEIKVKPGGIGVQGNGPPPRLTVKVEEGRGIMKGGEKGRNKEKSIAKGRVGKGGDHQTEETTLKSDDELYKLPSIIDQKAEEFLRTRKEAMIRKSSTNQITHF